MDMAHARVLAYAEAVTNVRAQTRTSSKGKKFKVRAHDRKIDEAVDERGNMVEVDDEGVDMISEWLEDEDIELQDIIDGFRTDREDFKVGNLEVTGDADEGIMFITGLIFDSKGKAVGAFDRELDFDNFEASHEQFTIVPEHRGKGIATDMNTNMFEMYRNMGFDSVRTYADGGRGIDGVGRYAWAMQGFDFASPKQADVLKLGFYAYLKEKGYNDTAEAVMNMKHSWEIASTTVNGEKLGKKFMIELGPNWSGKLILDDEHVSSKVFDVYAKNSKGKERK